MANNGSFATTSCEGRSLTFSWSIKSQSVANNTTTISWNLKGSGSYTYGWVACGGFKIVIDGSTVYNKSTDYRVNVSVGDIVASGTHTIAHTSDGSKTFSASVQAGIYTYAVNCSGSGEWALTPIARASSISTLTSSVDINGSNKVTVQINRANSSFTHTVQFYINNTYTHTVNGVATSTSYALPTSWLDAMPSSTSCTAYCKVTTYSGGTKVGNDVTKTFTVKVPSNIIPTVGTLTLIPDPINDRNILIQNKNTLQLSVGTCTAGQGSGGIKSYTFSGPGVSTTTTNTSVKSNRGISNTGTLTYTVTVTDTRGRTASKSASIMCYEWSVPTISITKAYRVLTSSSTVEDSSGQIIKFDYKLTYSSVGNTNKIDVVLYSKPQSAQSYTRLGDVLTGSTNISGTHAQGGFPSDTTYELYLSVADQYGGTNTSYPVTVFSDGRVFNVRQSRKGIAFGKFASSDDVLDSKWPIKTDDPAQTMKNLSYRGQNILSVSEDTSDTWIAMGNLATAYYSKFDYINGQPTQYGYLLNITAGPNSTQVHQLWAQQPNGTLFHRGGNTSSGFGTTWKEILDNSNCKDYIVAQGTSGKTTYRKWNSGLAEMWYYEDLGKMALTSNPVTGVYTNSNCNSRGASYPSGLFLTGTVPMATINVYSNGYTLCQVSEVQVDKNQFVYRVWSPYSTTLDSCSVTIYATGKWK